MYILLDGHSVFEAYLPLSLQLAVCDMDIGGNILSGRLSPKLEMTI